MVASSILLLGIGACAGLVVSPKTITLSKNTTTSNILILNSSKTVWQPTSVPSLLRKAAPLLPMGLSLPKSSVLQRRTPFFRSLAKVTSPSSLRLRRMRAALLTLLASLQCASTLALSTEDRHRTRKEIFRTRHHVAVSSGALVCRYCSPVATRRDTSPGWPLFCSHPR